MPWLLGSPVVEVELARAAAVLEQRLRRPAADPAPDGGRRALDRRDLPQRALRLRRPLRGRRRAGDGEPARTRPAPRSTPPSRRGFPYAADWRPRFAEAYRLELQAWVDSIGGADRGPLATAYDGLVASAVADAVITSMRSDGARVRVEVPKVPGGVGMTWLETLPSSRVPDPRDAPSPALGRHRHRLDRRTVRRRAAEADHAAGRRRGQPDGVLRRGVRAAVRDRPRPRLVRGPGRRPDRRRRLRRHPAQRRTARTRGWRSRRASTC